MSAPTPVLTAPPEQTALEPGCIVAVSRGDEVSFAAEGHAVLEHPSPIDEHTVFNVGSVAKQVTALVVLLADERGALDLDRPLADHVPSVGPTIGAVRLRHLLWHTSGIRDHGALLSIAGLRRQDFVSRTDVLALLRRQTSLMFPVGQGFAYSNSNYVLLGVAVEHALGASLRAVADELVVEPLGLHRTHVHDDLAEVVPGASRSYARGPDGALRTESTPTEIVGDNNLFSTAADMVRWLRSLRPDGPWPEAVRRRLLAAGSLDDGTPLPYGAGLQVWRHAGRSMVGHGGSFDGFRSRVETSPDDGFEVVVLANHAHIDVDARAREVVVDALGPDGAAAVPGFHDEEALRVVDLAVEGASTVATLREASTWASIELDGATIRFVRQEQGWESVPPLPGYRLDAGPGAEGAGATLVDPHGRRLHLSALDPVPPGQAVDLEGTYRSDELGLRMHVERADDGLWLRRNAARAELVARGRSRYTSEGMTVQVVTEGGEVVLVVDVPRATGLRFTREPRETRRSA